jgi:hypothetical protein
MSAASSDRRVGSSARRSPAAFATTSLFCDDSLAWIEGRVVAE